ncbi:hypothetical protein C8R45DRAFT_1087239 [Mycena sanguinolenta]|nr:hypothetical protein C8R45DRAFT_1087239 [Mycena sanguinolenta]
MHPALCPNSDLFALRDPCISWCALLPVILVFLLCIPAIPAPASVKRFGSFLSTPFQPFLTAEEAETLVDAPPVSVASASGPRRRTATLLVSLAFFEILVWIAVGVSGSLGTGVILSFIFATPWFYAFLRPLIKPPIITAPMDLFWLFTLEFVAAVVLLVGTLLGFGIAPQPLVMVFVGNMILTTSLLVVVLCLPLGVPTREPHANALEPSPEDYTSLFGWLTFSWVLPLIRRGVNNSLTEKDVWNLSPTMQARPVFHKFTRLRRATLLRSLLVANSSDLILDAILSVLSAVLNFASPFFLNLILSTLEHPAEGGQRLAYLYAFLAFSCQIAKSESDMVHNFFGRRASTRMKTELMIAIYEKALKRCDFTGIIDADAATKGSGKTRSDPAAAVGPKAGAQLSKIANLMSVDTNAVCALPTSIFFLYNAPFDLILSVVFLYRFVLFSGKAIDFNALFCSLLGWAAFAGVAFTLFCLPLNWATAKLGVKYEKGIVTARDKRTSAVNELISSIKFIKFGGAEERWLSRVNDAREVELSWLRKSRFVGVVTHLTWLIQPVLISASSFYVYIKLGNNLTVSTAFTAGVALSRISAFLEEDEVSTLKPDEQNDTVPPGLAIDGSFKWNELARDAETKPSEIEILETRFELQDISVAFPEGKITCVVGPTASGKTALLQALLGEMTCLPGTQIKLPKSSKVDRNGLMHCMSYCAQTPWLQYASIKDNIIFGFPFDEERYRTVLDACALLPDLAILPDGDRTEIGIRHVISLTLSV